MNYADLGFLRVAACAPVLALGNPLANAATIASSLQRLRGEHVAVALYPELCLTGYSCEDLFFANALHQHVRTGLAQVAAASRDIVAVVGAPWRATDGRLLNVACVFGDGRLLGVVPKAAHPNYGEFYERRWFVAANELDEVVGDPDLGEVRIGREQLFSVGGVKLAVEICEDLWAPDSPGAAHSLAGAQLILNLSASTELVSKAQYRRDLVRMTSAQRICAYLYAGAGPFESTKDVVFGGHCLAAENGVLIAESPRFEPSGTTLITEFDIAKITSDRTENTTFTNTARPEPYALVQTGVAAPPLRALTRDYSRHPFVPDDPGAVHENAREIMQIQATGLARRMQAAHVQRLVIGLSGGLDSTLAYLVCLDALERLSLPRSELHALTMPGPGTTSGTKRSAKALATVAGASLKVIPITRAVNVHLKDLDHDGAHDVVFENAQARERTQLLFNYANQVGGIVVGTGDLSELALGWCTFNADQMANYNVNAGVPKTLVSHLVRWYAEQRADAALAKLLKRVLDTPITPELIPHDDDEISQPTEAIIGPYELHDFFLYHWLRNGSTPSKIFALATRAFDGAFTPATILQWLDVFFRRFFAQQFKRTTLPPGPKVGTLSLSPRGDWRMPDEVDAAAFLAEIDGLHGTL